MKRKPAYRHTRLALAVAAALGTAAMAPLARAGSQLAQSNSASQVSTGNGAGLGGNAMQNASGNIGVNSASGSINEQTNSASMSSTLGDTGASATNVNTQGSGANSESMGRFLGSGYGPSFSYFYYNQAGGGSNLAGLRGSALQNALGNIGVNAAAGLGNQQQNSLEAAAAGGGDATAANVSLQTSAGNVSAQEGTISEGFSGSFSFFSSSAMVNRTGLRDNALQNAQGNIGVNTAAGTGNQQQNGLAMASAGNGVLGSAIAAAGAGQSSSGDSAIQDLVENIAGVRGNALQFAKGNIGVNAAAGIGDQQANNAALASSGAASYMFTGGAEGTAFAAQSSLFNSNSQIASPNTTGVRSNALEGAQGNIGVNVAAGIGNQQANDLAIASAAGGYASAGAGASQLAAGNYAPNDGTNNASVDGSALRSASGNIGVNAAAGIGNQQANGLALASAGGTFTYNGNASASAGAGQATSGSASDNFADNNASVGGLAGVSASGNIGVNVASGNGNQQANDTAAATTDTFLGTSSAMASGSQSALDSGYMYGAYNNANVGGAALYGASGKIGVNVAAGTSNQQGNAMALSNQASGSYVANASASGLQSAGYGGYYYGGYYESGFRMYGGTNNASVGGAALEETRGNIGVNVAAGAVNQQQNEIAMANTVFGNANGTAGSSQSESGSAALNFAYNDANVGSGALAGASGNIGVNAAAGIANQQGNALALANTVYGPDDAAAAGSQSGFYGARMLAGSNSANLEGAALEKAGGNIGVNLAAGTGNQQQNAAAVANAQWFSTSASAVDSQRSAGSALMSGYNFYNYYDPANNNANVGSYALFGASGNIGVNAAAGAGNQQANALAIATSLYGSATAAASGPQSAFYAATMFTVNNSATLGGSALANAGGNIGVNLAAGAGNQQQNALAMATSKPGFGYGSGLATAGGDQGSSGNGTMSGVFNMAAIQGNALQGATGNIGVNAAAGIGNQQENMTAIAVSDGTMASATATPVQVSMVNSANTSGVTNQASLGGTVLTGASGNIGVNLAAGVGNEQANDLAIAVHP